MIPLVVAVLLAGTIAGSASAARPTFTPGGEPPGDDSVLPLTPEQEASRTVKEAIIDQLIADGTDGGITPQYVCQFEPCEPSTKQLTVYARQQTKSYYCGPAVVQIVSNFSWGKTGTANKYTQKAISDNWTHTDASGQTYLVDEIYGMNQATKRPSNFVYMQKHNPTFDNWHGTIIGGVYYWGLPLAAGVIPAKQGATYQLVSWNKVSNGGHYLELHGYEGRVGSSSPDVYFSDTAGTYADSVAANWKQASYAVYQTMMYNNGNMIY